MRNGLPAALRDAWKESLLSRDEILSLAIPGGRLSGVYFLIHEGEVVYVGRSENILGRIAAHISEGEKEFDSFTYLPAGPIREGHYIKLLNPKYNKMWADHA